MTNRGQDNVFNLFSIAAYGNDIQHELMAESYRSVIYDVLDQIYPNMPAAEKEALTWFGLRGYEDSDGTFHPTAAWNNLFQSN